MSGYDDHRSSEQPEEYSTKSQLIKLFSILGIGIGIILIKQDVGDFQKDSSPDTAQQTQMEQTVNFVASQLANTPKTPQRDNTIKSLNKAKVALDTYEQLPGWSCQKINLLDNKNTVTGKMEIRTDSLNNRKDGYIRFSDNTGGMLTLNEYGQMQFTPLDYGSPAAENPPAP